MSRTVVLDIDDVSKQDDGLYGLKKGFEAPLLTLPDYYSTHLYEMPMYIKVGKKTFTMAKRYYDWTHSLWVYERKNFLTNEYLYMTK